jgi:transposase, IS5 family
MSLNLSGLDAKVSGAEVCVQVDTQVPLIKLANLIDWESLYLLILPDLKKTPTGKMHLGRSLQVRTHLGAYILQNMFNDTDRETEERLNFDAKWQLFCGRNVVKKWNPPDHTKIEKFRNRFSPATHHALGAELMKFALAAGFTKPNWMDVDSTVQEANISYPSDATLMTKIAHKAHIVAEAISAVGQEIVVNLKSIKSAAKEYFFLAKNKAKTIKRKVFAKLHAKVVTEVVPVVEAAWELSNDQICSLNTRAKRAMDILLQKAASLLEDIRIFIKTQQMVPTKILSLHAEKLACISKGKLGKPHEFGRVLQLGRLPGNFLLIGKSKTIRESDKSAIGAMIFEHSKLFGSKKLESLGTDKGYASDKNIRSAKAAGIKEIGIQQPWNTKNGKLEHSPERRLELENRRAGIEPLIGHCKHGGLRRSRMKSDVTTESSAYRSVMGFNLRQMNRHIGGFAV